MSRRLIRSGMHAHRRGEQSDQAWGGGGYGREQVTKFEVTHKRGHFGSFYNTACHPGGFWFTPRASISGV